MNTDPKLAQFFNLFMVDSSFSEVTRPKVSTFDMKLNCYYFLSKNLKK